MLPYPRLLQAVEAAPPDTSSTESESTPPDDSPAPDEILGVIQKITFQGVQSKPLDTVADVAILKVGDTLTRSQLENSINDLRKWGIFSQVEVLVAYENGQVELTYELVEGYIIRDVYLSGNYPILKTRVQRTLFLNPGQIYDPAKLPEQIDRLDKLYEENGYFGTTVLAVEDYDEANHTVTLYFKIEKGATFRLRNYDIEGNTALYPKRIRTIIFTYSHYKPKTIKKDLKKIESLYNRKGFVRAKVRLANETYDYDARKVDLKVLIQQGPQIEVFFKGNHHFLNRTLKKNITLYEDGDFDDFELEASKKKLTSFYQRNGFENAQVEFQREKINPNLYRITFTIEEGPQRQVKAIEFEGNENVKSSTLHDLLSTKKNSIGDRGYYLQPLFEQDLTALESYYHDEGYLNMEVKNWDKTYSPLGDKVTLTVHLDEGPRAQTQAILFKDLPKDLEPGVRESLTMKPGTVYSPARMATDIQNIIIHLTNRGYPYTEVSHEVIEIQPHQYQITYTVRPGKKVSLGRILFVGNALTKESVLRRNLRVKEGDPFSALKILESEINLRGLGIFDSVHIETLGLSSHLDRVNLVVRVQEKRTNTIDLEAGYYTDLGFSGQVVFNKLNVGGTGKNFLVSAQGGQEVNRLQLNWIDNRFRGTGLQLIVGLFGGREYRPFFTSTNVGGFTSVSKGLGRNVRAFGRVNLEYVDNNDTDTVFEKLNPTYDPNQRTRFVTTVGVIRDTRDSFGDPRRGLFLNGQVQLTNQFIQIGGNYATLQANMGYWYSPMRRFTIANALRVAQIIAIPGSTIIPADQRLYLGGDDTVRGFKQDSLLPSGGNFSLVYNLEFQMRMVSSFMLVGFLDSGVVTNSIQQVNLTTLRHAAGPGLRYTTPVGPIRLDYGFVLDPQPGDASDQRLHFSFGYFF